MMDFKPVKLCRVRVSRLLPPTQTRRNPFKYWHKWTGWVNIETSLWGPFLFLVDPLRGREHAWVLPWVFQDVVVLLGHKQPPQASLSSCQWAPGTESEAETGSSPAPIFYQPACRHWRRGDGLSHSEMKQEEIISCSPASPCKINLNTWRFAQITRSKWIHLSFPKSTIHYVASKLSF